MVNSNVKEVQISKTDVEAWEIKDLIEALSDNPVNKKKISIPKYQRNLVWSSQQKKLLIDSIKDGLPIGAILLYNDEPENGLNIFRLIDGLQRSTSIKTYIDNPTSFYDSSNLPDKFSSEVSSFMIESNIHIEENAIEKLILMWINVLKGFKESKGFSSSRLATYLDEKTGDKLKKEDARKLTDLCVPYIEKILLDSDINSIKIPVIIYSGDKGNLPTIFERLNSKGTQLTKYQVFAATWSTYEPFSITNREIIEKIKAKYDSIIDAGLEIENYDDTNFYSGNFNYFEFFFGLGKYLSFNFKSLFGKESNKDQTDSIGFTLGSLCVYNDLKQMGSLPSLLDIKTINLYGEKIEDACNIVYRILKPYIGIRANKKNGSQLPVVHSELQIASIIAKVFTLKYDQDLNVKSTWRESEAKLVKNIPFHYLYDILRSYWSGTGDSKALELVNIENDTYLKPIKKASWDFILNEVIQNELEKKEKTRINIKNELILFLKYIYCHLLTAHQEMSLPEFEIEHIIPVARLKKIATIESVNGLPIGALANIALIDKSINRDKKDKTVYEYYKIKIDSGEMNEEQIKQELQDMEKMTFTKKDDLSFIEKFDEHSTQEYIQFLENRFMTLKNKFYELNKIED